MAEVSVEELFVSAGVNPRSHCLAACRQSNRFVYASDGHVVLQKFSNTSCGQVLSVSDRHHSGQVTILKRVSSVDQEGTVPSDFFLAGGSDGRVTLYEINESPQIWHHQTLEGLEGSVGALCGMLSQSQLILAASWVTGEGSGVHLWWLDMVNFSFSVSGSYDVPDLGNAFVLTADMQKLKNGCTLIAFGTTKRTIEFYVEAPFEKAIKPVLSITGHEDWIDSLAFNKCYPILLATAGQDTQVKLWRIEEVTDSKDLGEISVLRNRFVVEGDHSLFLSIGIESVLSGHDDWVQSVEWDKDGRILITSSSDKTVIVWKETKCGELWTDNVRLGIVGGQAAGFYCAVFSPDANQIIASSYFGGLYSWIAPESEEKLWTAAPVSSGHVGAVRDLAWHPRGRLIFSVGEDKTTRVYLWPKNESKFVEIGRPQIHGHSMQCIDVVSRSIIVTGAEEKIFRAFEAPSTFVKSVYNIGSFDKEEIFGDCRPTYYGARVPALGLSNKAVDDSQELQPEANGEVHWEEGAFQASPAELFSPPTEDCLQQNTLWPEVQKLYGHGYEVYAIAANPTGTVLATSCKASQTEDATIVLWDTSDWSKKGEIPGHQLTVTQLEWSPDGRVLLSVSRDRKAILYREQYGDINGFAYVKFWSSAKEHSRIIWSCSWCSDSRHFVTASRDMQVILWESNDSGATAIGIYKCSHPVTSVAFGYGEEISDSLIAAGLQDGSIALLKFTEKRQLSPIYKHYVPPVDVDQAVLRLRFSPVDHNVLAVAGSDGMLRILRVQILDV